MHMGFQISYFNLYCFRENILLDKQPEFWDNPSLNIRSNNDTDFSMASIKLQHLKTLISI